MFYYLVAGRWFSGPSLDGPWTLQTPDLPGDFKRIPVEHPRSAFWRRSRNRPGNRGRPAGNHPYDRNRRSDPAKSPEVIYQGEPEFQPIKDTALWQAVNTDKQIIKFGEQY
ncbi:MAG: hypothetical protein IPG58_17100 [Acidobacteria bacterium]|nr:hypothetical protein [Acidobacteriota bacterium]